MNIRRFLPLSALVCLLGSSLLAAPAATTPPEAAPKSAESKFTVEISFANGPENDMHYDSVSVEVPKGATALDAIKQAGLIDYATNKAVLEISGTPDGGDRRTTREDVGEVRGLKAKDAILEPSADGQETAILILYKDFEFDGGQPLDFIKALKEQFGVNWSAAHIPDQLIDVRIPAFRKSESAYSDNACNAYNVVKLYNSIASRYPGIGTWSWDGDILKPNFVMLVPGKDAKTAADEIATASRVKAFPLASIRASKWAALESDIYRTADIAEAYSRRGGHDNASVIRGMASIQRDSEILVAIGNPGYIDMVESLVAAYEKNEAVNNALGPQPSAK